MRLLIIENGCMLCKWRWGCDKVHDLHKSNIIVYETVWYDYGISYPNLYSDSVWHDHRDDLVDVTNY